MEKFLHRLIKGLPVFFLLFCSFSLHAQILVQDFETISALNQFSAANPTKEQVNALLESSTDNETVFSLYELPGRGQTMLRLEKGGRKRVWWIKEQPGVSPQVLKLQFKMMVTEPSSSSKQGDIGSFYVGENLKKDGTYPLNENRFATIDVSWEGGDLFSVSNILSSGVEGENELVEGTFTTAGLSTVAIFMNSSAGTYSYVSPQGQQEDIGAGKIDMWVNGGRVVNEATARAEAPLQAIKFVSRNNTLAGTAYFDDFLIEDVPAYVAPPALDEQGGTYTVGTGGDFPSLTNPGGVFQALNELGTISGPFNFLIISDLMGETGTVPLNQIAGASQQNTIQFRPRQAGFYTVSGANEAAAGAMIRLNGADWVRFDGRLLADSREGIGVDSYLVFRNAGTAPTFHLYNDAIRNTLAYSTVQGASFSADEGVIFLGNAASEGNDANSFLYNRIGGYGIQSPVNALAARNTTAGTLTEALLIEGNQFYGFAATASLNTNSFPCSILAGLGSSQWDIRGNHLFQEAQAEPVVAAGQFDLNGVCLQAGTDYLIEENYIGGSAPFALGSPLTVRTNGAIGVYPSLIPFNIETSEGVVNIRGNTATNIDITGAPFACNALAFGSVVTAGEVHFTDNNFGDPEGISRITARNSYSGNTSGGSYMVAPIYYGAKGDNSSSGSVTNNFIGSVRLEGNSSAAGFADINFRGVLSNQNAFISQISQNTIANVQSDVSGNIGVSMLGIHTLGRGVTEISRNVIYDFVNNSEAVALQCPVTTISEANTMGIVADNISGETLVANNMITFEAHSPLSATVYYGIYVPSNSPDQTNVLYNSVYISGADNQAIGSNFVFYRNGASPTTVLNNIFLNTRSTDNANFVIGTTDVAGWRSGYNLLYQASGSPAISDFGLYGSDFIADCAAWLALAGIEGSVCANVAEDFVDPESGNLRIVRTGTASPVLDAGLLVEAVETDIDFVLRIDPDIGASEGFNTWIGVVSTDWFNPANWSAGVVPSCGGNPDLLGQNQLSIAPIGTRFYDQLVQFQPVIEGNAPAFYRNLIIQDDASVTIGGSNAKLMQCGGGLDPLREGITNRGTIAYTAPGRISLKGVLNNEGTFVPGTGTLVLAGDAVQNINSTEDLQLWRLLIEGGGSKNLYNDVIVLNSLDLVEGIVVSSADSTLILESDAVLGEEAAPDNDAYVAGPMIKRFNSAEAFVFPVGDENQLGRAAVIPAGGEAVSFVVEYFFDAPPFPTENTDETAEFFQDGIARVSQTEYWLIRPLEADADAQVVLYWDENSGVEPIEDKVQDLSVVRWNALIPAWVSEGNDGIEDAPAPALGRLFSVPQLSGFGVFTFGTPNPNVGLPVDLVSFTAALAGGDVKLSWETAMEKSSSHFNVQRSQDGVIFENIGRVASFGNSQQSLFYEFVDEKIADRQAGTVYYRLEQVDVDGSSERSAKVSLLLPDEAFSIRGIYPNPFRDKLVLNIKGSKQQRLALRLLDVNGRQLLEQHVQVLGEENIMPVLKVHGLEEGIYILEISSSEETRQFKVVKN